MRFFKVQGKRSTFPWAVVWAVGTEREGWEEACLKSQGPDLECHTQMDTPKWKGVLNWISVFKRGILCVSKHLCLYLFRLLVIYLCLLDTECKAILKLEVRELAFPPSKQFLVDTCWVLFNPFSSDAIRPGDVYSHLCSEAVHYQAGTCVSDQLPTNQLSTISPSGLINLLVTCRIQENIFFHFSTNFIFPFLIFLF